MKFTNILISSALASSLLFPTGIYASQAENPIRKASTVSQDEEASTDRSATAVAVYIANILAAYFIDGVLINVTGYSGGELCAEGLNALTRLTAENSKITQAYFNSVNSAYVDAYSTSDGNECVRTTGTTYACKYGGLAE